MLRWIVAGEVVAPRPLRLASGKLSPTPGGG
jgi:hypothetical protein